MRMNPEVPLDSLHTVLPEEDPEKLELLKVSQVAKIFSVTEWTVRTWLREGSIRGIKIAGASHGHWRVTRKEIARFANERYGDGS